MIEIAAIATGFYLASRVAWGWLKPKATPVPVPVPAHVDRPASCSPPFFTPDRGARRTTQGQVRRRFDADTSTGPGFELAGVRWPAREYLNKLIFLTGRPGTGKTVMEKLMMASVADLFGTLPEWAGAGLYPGEGRMRWFVIDPTDAYLPYLDQSLPGDVPIIRASPHDAGGWAWDVAKDVDSDAMNDAFQSALFPDSLFAKAGDPFWYTKAREITKALVEVYHDLGSDWEFCDLVIPIKYPQFLRPVLAQSPRTRGKLRHELVGRLGRDIIATSSSVINRMTVAAALWRRAKRKFSLGRFLDERAVLHFAYTPAMIASLAGIANALTHVLILKGLTRNDEFDHTILWLDEGRYLADLAGLEDLAARGRGAGFGAVVSAQGTPGLVSKWGEGRVKELIDLACTWVTFSAGYETARAFSQVVGQFEGLQKSHGANTTHGRSESSTSSRGGGHSGGTWGTSTSVSSSSSTTVSQSFQLTIKDAILPGEITNLPLADRAGDLIRGFAFNPDVGAYEFTVPFLDHFRELADPPFPGMPLRPASDQRLDPWRENDLLRLKLEPTPRLIKALKTTWKITGGTP